MQENLCNEGQGYLFSQPLPAGEFVRCFHTIEQIIPRNGIPPEISYRRWAVKELQHAREELLETVRQQQGMIFKYKEVDGKFIHTLCDGELLYRMNFSSEQIIGKELCEFLPPNYANEKICFYRRAWEGEENVTYEGAHNGIYYIATLRPIRRGGQVVEVIGSSVDITERKIAEEKLRLSECKFRLITENMHDLIGILDKNGIFSYASPSHETVLGFPPLVYEGNFVVEMVHPNDQQYVQTQFAYIVESQASLQFEFRYKHARRGWVYVESKGTPVLDDKNQVEHLIFVTRDISERKNVEELIRKSE